MGPIMLLAGVLLLIFGGAALGGQTTAATRQSRARPKAYGVVCLAAGAGLVGWGLVIILA